MRRGPPRGLARADAQITAADDEHVSGPFPVAACACFDLSESATAFGY